MSCTGDTSSSRRIGGLARPRRGGGIDLAGPGQEVVGFLGLRAEEQLAQADNDRALVLEPLRQGSPPC
jgi:hypothetical protein